MEQGDTQSEQERQNQEILDLSLEIYDFLEEKKAENLQLMRLVRVNPYFNYFLIATATSKIHLKALVRDLKKKYGDRLPQKTVLREDDAESGWVVLDFIDLVLHLFLEEERGYYNLERLWGDAEFLKGASKQAQVK